MKIIITATAAVIMAAIMTGCGNTAEKADFRSKVSGLSANVGSWLADQESARTDVETAPFTKQAPEEKSTDKGADVSAKRSDGTVPKASKSTVASADDLIPDDEDISETEAPVVTTAAPMEQAPAETEAKETVKAPAQTTPRTTTPAPAQTTPRTTTPAPAQTTPRTTTPAPAQTTPKATAQAPAETSPTVSKMLDSAKVTTCGGSVIMSATADPAKGTVTVTVENNMDKEVRFSGLPKMIGADGFSSEFNIFNNLTNTMAATPAHAKSRVVLYAEPSQIRSGMKLSGELHAMRCFANRSYTITLS